MSRLGALFPDDAETIGPFVWVRQHLEQARRDGFDFDTAWATAMRRVGGLDHSRPPGGGQSVHEFARARFERAYHGLDPSIRSDDHGPRSELEAITRQEAIAV